MRNMEEREREIIEMERCRTGKECAGLALRSDARVTVAGLDSKGFPPFHTTTKDISLLKTVKYIVLRNAPEDKERKVYQYACAKATFAPAATMEIMRQATLFDHRTRQWHQYGI